jgi:ATP-binding cassette subfamily B protein
MALPGLAWLVGHVIKGPVATGDGAATFRALVLFTVFFIVADVALYWRIRLAHQIGENVLRDLRDKLMAHLLTQPLSFFHARRHGSLISRMISDIEAMRNGIQNNFFISFVSFGQMSCAAALMLLANPRLFLVLLAIVPCLLLVHGFFRGKILHASRVQQETFSRVTSALAETVQGIRVTQGFAREDTNAGIFTRLVRSLAGNVVKTASLTALYLPLLELNAQGFMAALIGVGGWAALSGTGTGLGDLVTFFFLADLFFSPITIIGTQLSEATLAMAGAERYFRLLDTPPAWTDQPTAAACPPLKGHVEFRDIHFAYVRDRPVLHGISFVARPGQVIALVGHTGSGKSTIIGLLAKFQLPLKGQVRVDGHDLADIRQETLRRQMGFVFQREGRPTRRHRRGDPAGLPRPGLPRPHRGPPGRHPYAVFRERPRALDGAAAARGLRPGPAREPAHPRARRGHQRRRHAHGSAAPGRPRPPDEGAHLLRGRPSSQHHPAGRLRHRPRRRPHRRTRHA